MCLVPSFYYCMNSIACSHWLLRNAFYHKPPSFDRIWCIFIPSETDLTFNQWSPCSVWLHSAPAESCRHLCSNPVDAQRLSRLRRFPRWLSSISDCWIESLMLFTSYSAFNQWSPYSVSPHSDQAVCVDAHALARWMHSAFRAYGVFYAGSLPPVVAGSNGLCLSLVSGVQPMVTVQCFTAFWPGRVV